MDLGDNLSSKRSIQKDDSERFEASESEPSARDTNDQSKIGTQINPMDVKERTNNFIIKNYEIAQNFMKGRQCGRENTPSRKGLSKKQKSNLSKIKPKFNLNNAVKAWEEDETQMSGTSLDRVEVIRKPKITKISKIKTDLKQIKSNFKVVRVGSSRRSKEGKKRITKKRNPAGHPFKVNSNLTASNSGSVRYKRSKMPPLPVIKNKSKSTASILSSKIEKNIDKIDKVCQKHLLKHYFKLWRVQVPSKELNVSSHTVTSKHSHRHKKKVSEYIKKPFSLLLINPPKNRPKEEERKLKSLVDDPDIINEASFEDEKEIIKKVKKVLEEHKESPTQDKGFKVIQLEQTEHSFDQSQGSKRAKNLSVSIFKPVRKSKKKKKTKEAIERFNQINSMLEKLQKDAARLSKEYKNVKIN